MLNEFALLKPVIRDPIGSFQFLVETIVAQLETDELEDEQACRQSDAQPKDVDGRKHLVLENIAESDGEVVFKHIRCTG